MKIRESGMPEKSYWEKLLDVDLILKKLEINKEIETLVEFGCGYGTFTIPSSKTINGNIFSFDIDNEVLEITKNRLVNENIKNVDLYKRDFILNGTGIEENSVDYVMLFNILHHESPEDLLNESYKILKKNGKLGIIHWNYDSNTPRGPSMEIRPRPDNIKQQTLNVGFDLLKKEILDLPPYHYGFLFFKP